MYVYMFANLVTIVTNPALHLNYSLSCFAPNFKRTHPLASSISSAHEHLRSILGIPFYALSG